MVTGKQLYFPSSGYGRGSHHYDADLLFDGTYDITSVVLHETARDMLNSDTKDIRKGMLLVKSSVHVGFYEPLDTSDGKLNGVTPSQSITDAVVLGCDVSVDKVLIMMDDRIRVMIDKDIIVPVYLAGSFWDDVFIYNNSENVVITENQWANIQRIERVPRGMRKYEDTSQILRALLHKRVENFR